MEEVESAAGTDYEGVEYRPTYRRRHTIPSEFLLHPEAVNPGAATAFIHQQAQNGLEVIEVNEARDHLSRTKLWIEPKAGYSIRGMHHKEIIDDVECLEYIYLPENAKSFTLTVEQRMNQLLKKDWRIPLWQLLEVRPGKESPSFRKHKDRLKTATGEPIPDDRCLSVFFGTHCDFKLTQSYGQAFHWHNRSFIFNSAAECASWRMSFKYIQWLWHSYTTPQRKMLYYDTWYWALKGSETYLRYETFKTMGGMERLNCDNTSGKAKKLAKKWEQEIDRQRQGILTQSDFRQMMDEVAFIKQPEIFGYIKNHYSVDLFGDPDGDLLKLFMKKVNGESWVYPTDNREAGMWNTFLEDQFGGEAGITSQKVMEFLFSEENSIQRPSLTYIRDDYMTEPPPATTKHGENFKSSMADYQINSSHNTYLVSDQLWGLSSVEAYIRSLRMGCRCVEIDTWNGNDPKFGRGLAHNKDEIVVLHGWTITSTILFRDVLAVIRDHAFAVSDLPVILSIENHCTNKDDANGKMQDKMGKYFKEIFGDLLLLEEVRPEDESGELMDRLPPPYALRNKIIVKYKKNKDTWRRNNLTSLSDVWDYRNSEVGSQLHSDMSRASITESNMDSEWTIDEAELPPTQEEMQAKAMLFDAGDLKVAKQEMRELQKLTHKSVSRSSTTTSTYGNKSCSEMHLIDLLEDDTGGDVGNISRQLSSCVVYCIANKFSKLSKHKGTAIDVRMMSSIAYNALDRVTSSIKGKRKLIEFSANRFLRNYPPGLHFWSSNYNPITCWNVGAQLVALNFQNADRYITYNHAKFNVNSGLGFLKKPDYMITPEKGVCPPYAGIDDDQFPAVIPWTEFELSILGARHIARHIEVDGVSFPDIKIEVIGPNETSYSKNKEAKDCGGFALQFLNPIRFPKTNIRYFNDSFLYIELSEKGIYGTRIRVGQATIQLGHIRPGIRSIPLCDRYNQPHPMATLLVDVRFKHQALPKLPQARLASMMKNKQEYMVNWLDDLPGRKESIRLLQKHMSRSSSSTTTNSTDDSNKKLVEKGKNKRIMSMFGKK